MSRWKAVFEGQWIHLVGAGSLIAATVGVTSIDRARLGEVAGVGAPEWIWWAVVLALLHQLWVWLCWRAELHSGGMSRVFGTAAFSVYSVVFSLLGIGRVVAVWVLAYANRGTVDLEPGLGRLLAVTAAVPALYLVYSVARYFGFRRALGADHFDPGYRGASLERRGIFRYTRNGMYCCGFLVLWIPALWWCSAAALWVALLNHLYIGVHYFATERPDMRRIYGAAALRRADERASGTSTR